LAERRAVPFLFAFAALASGTLGAAAPKTLPPGPPFDFAAPTPHQISFTVDTAPARDVLALLSGAPDAPATLRRLKASTHAAAAIRAEGLSPDDFYGRLVSTIAGTPDPLLSAFTAKHPYFSRILDAIEADGAPSAALEARRIASILPTGRPITASFVAVPFFGVSGFAEVSGVRDGDTLVLAADLPRLTGDLESAPVPREVLLKLLRAASAEAWRSLFEANVRRAPVWPDDKLSNFDTLLARSVVEGPSTLFLIPDDFFPVIPLLEDPIVRAFARWNRAAELLLDDKKKESERLEILMDSSRGDFWNRYAAIVGAQMTDAILRLAGREKYLAALEAGPRAVVSLYVEVTKGKKLPELSKAVKSALEAKPAATKPPEKKK
jgi:hypothetical protein